MKKLFALVMVLAMAFAIAMPTLAATGWDKPATTPPTYDDFEMAVDKYEYYSASAGGYGANGVYFPNWDDKKGIVKDTLGRVVFSFVLPKLADAQALYPGVDFTQPVTVNFKITNIKGVQNATSANFYPTLSTDPSFFSSSKNQYTGELTYTLGTAEIEGEYMFVFAAASAADVVATMTISAGDDELAATFVYSKVVVTADATTLNGCDFIFKTTDQDALLFDVDSADKIQRVFLLNGGVYYQVLVDVNGVISFKDGNASIQVGDPATETLPAYATLKGRYDFFMGALGFAWDGTAKYMNEDLIVDNLVKGASGSASATFPAGYQSIVDPTVKPPQTGDASTVVGFVMIALALVAAAAVTVKKVRA